MILENRSLVAMDTIQKDNLDKAEGLEQFKAVVSERDTNSDVGQSQIYYIMRQSSFKLSMLVRHVCRLITPAYRKRLLILPLITRYRLHHAPIAQ